MQRLISKNEIVCGIKKLNVVERLGLITEIWDDIKESQALELISDDERKILLNRLAGYTADPDSATDWMELKQEIYNRYAEES
jgi:putative addiction module component (TIGR02574 family)